MLIYDGDCGFCTATAMWAARRLGDRAPVEPWQALDLVPLGLTVDEVSTAAYWIEADGTPRRGHLAVARTAEALGGAYRPVGWLLGRPPVSWLARPAYRLVARYRYRLPGSTDACRIG